MSIDYMRHHQLWCKWQNSPSTPQNVVPKVNFRRHPLQKFTFDTTFCGVEGEFLPSTPQFVVSKVTFCHRHHNLWCSSRNFSSAPNFSTGAEIVGVWKTKSYLEDFYFSALDNIICLRSIIIIHQYKQSK